METKLSSTQKIEVSVINAEKERGKKSRLAEIEKKELIEYNRTKFGIRLDLLTGLQLSFLRA
jgi:hypothetical protein